MEVAVYKNLHRNQWSIAQLKGRRGYGKVIDHCNAVVLRDCRMVVREGARQAVLRDHCRTVHAFITGTIVSEIPSGEQTAITYNPYRCGTFTERATGAAVESAAYVIFTSDEGAYAINPQREDEHENHL
jgi:hypothetical protein